MIRRRALAAIGCAVALALAATPVTGCGDDEEATTTPTTEPATPTGATGPGATGGDDESKDNGSGGAGDIGLEDGTVSPPPETDPEDLPTDPAEDGPGNDLPPEPGSAAEQFEKFCDANPDACG